MYTLDTNAIIYYLKGDTSSVNFLKDILGQDVPIYVSAITEVELFGFSQLNSLEMRRIEELLYTLSIIPLDSRIARDAGLLRRVYRLKVADSVIAATALFTGTQLVTRNIRDFRKIPNLLIAKI
mgnify:CR=1 FL=1